MLQMTTCPSTLSIIVTVMLWYPSTLMSEPWKKSKNQTETTYLPMLPQNQLVNMHYLNVLPTVTCYPANVNRCIPSFKKTEVSSDPALLISPAPHLYNITLTLVMLNPSNNKRTALATITVRKSKSKWKKCYATVSSNQVLALGLALLCWLQKQITPYDPAKTIVTLIKPP